MIEQMTKYTFLVFHGDYEAFLTKLREAGVVHINEKAEGYADNENLQHVLAQAKDLERILKQGASLDGAQADYLTASRAVYRRISGCPYLTGISLEGPLI